MILLLMGCQSASDEPAERSAPKARELVDVRDRILAYTEQARPDASYTPPGDEERERLAQGVDRLLAGDARAAEGLIGPIGFTVTRITDTGSGRRFDEIAARDDGPAARWGRLYLTADSAVRWNVQVPHPTSDRDTDALGVRLLESTPGGALVVAGAHRESGTGDTADVAHRQDSVFHAMVAELVRRNVPSLQVHGFSDSRQRPYDAVVSTGAAQSAPGEVVALADRMRSEGLRVCRGWRARCPVEGTTNVQGREAQRGHTLFVHVELAPDARDDGPEADEAADALSGLLADWARD
ncbi:hypothetical protein [Streptomyces sp. ODS05-4]|uniref:hypothetical protein n=1 Tax=Streptomyces sp. ODS05-4 TaxID=2944939 RepID=UPI002109908C|nr:hypothetical protein [Streptomyces sp. ODS05-4]